MQLEHARNWRGFPRWHFCDRELGHEGIPDAQRSGLGSGRPRPRPGEPGGHRHPGWGGGARQSAARRDEPARRRGRPAVLPAAVRRLPRVPAGEHRGLATGSGALAAGRGDHRQRNLPGAGVRYPAVRGHSAILLRQPDRVRRAAAGRERSGTPSGRVPAPGG